MITIAWLTLVASLALAFANGANDVSKAVATLVGSRQATYRAALMWGTAWTVAGALAATVLTPGLVRTFSTALVSSSVAASSIFPLAVVTGACGWVVLACLLGLPVSTTHALAGGIVGAGLALNGLDGPRWPLLATAVALPLAVSPLLAAAMSRGLHAVLRRRLARAASSCVCVQNGLAHITPSMDGTAVGEPFPTLRSGDAASCSGDTTVLSVEGVHWLASAVLSVARGLNDNPKISALAALVAPALGVGGPAVFAASALAMGAGSWWGYRVTRTLAENITDIDPSEGVTSSVTSAALVLSSSFLALPVSTTHVATGAIIGAGLSAGVRAVRWGRLGGILLAWIVTLPVAALLAACTVWIWRLYQ